MRARIYALAAHRKGSVSPSELLDFACWVNTLSQRTKESLGGNGAKLRALRGKQSRYFGPSQRTIFSSLLFCLGYLFAGRGIIVPN